MRLRTQLSLFFAGVMMIVLLLGGLSIWSGSKVVSIFGNALGEMEELSRFRTLQTLLSRQRTSLNAFLLFGDAEERDRFDALDRLIETGVAELGDTLSDPELSQSLSGRHKDLRAAAEKVFDLYARDKDRAYRQASEALMPTFQDLLGTVNQAEERVSQRVRRDQEDIKGLVEQGGQLIFIFVLWQVLLGAIFAFSTFRSLNRSLIALQTGTEAFGRGNLDHRIPVQTKDELGRLALSFNEMASNIKQLEVQTVHMHRMSAVGQLAGGVAHEINNPLTGVLGQAQLLLEKIPPDVPYRRHVEKIERAADRCRRIVRSLLDFSRQKKAQMDPLDAHETLEAALDLCEADLQGGRVELRRELSTSLPRLLGNAPQLQQVFLNIVGNAVHAMPQGGRLTISTHAGPAKLPRFPEERPMVELRFSDTGTGIEPSHLGHLFEPFFTTKEIGKGTGLGLSVSLGIIRNHGGDILAESPGPGQGAVFRVYLPPYEDAVKMNLEQMDESWGVIGQGTPSAAPRF